MKLSEAASLFQSHLATSHQGIHLTSTWHIIHWDAYLELKTLSNLSKLYWAFWKIVPVNISAVNSPGTNNASIMAI